MPRGCSSDTMFLETCYSCVIGPHGSQGDFQGCGARYGSDKCSKNENESSHIYPPTLHFEGILIATKSADCLGVLEGCSPLRRGSSMRRMNSGSCKSLHCCLPLSKMKYSLMLFQWHKTEQGVVQTCVRVGLGWVGCGRGQN